MAADFDVVVGQWLSQLPELEHIIDCNGLSADNLDGLQAATSIECFFGTSRLLVMNSLQTNFG